MISGERLWVICQQIMSNNCATAECCGSVGDKLRNLHKLLRTKCDWFRDLPSNTWNWKVRAVCRVMIWTHCQNANQYQQFVSFSHSRIISSIPFNNIHYYRRHFLQLAALLYYCVAFSPPSGNNQPSQVVLLPVICPQTRHGVRDIAIGWTQQCS